MRPRFGATGKKKSLDTLNTVQRGMALRVAMAYRTVSMTGAQVIAGVIPIHLLIDERRRIMAGEGPREAVRKAERDITLSKWQLEYDQGDKGRWTRRVLKELKGWIKRKQGETNYFLKKFLTGHGSFGSCLLRFKKTLHDDFIYCGETETAEHAIFECPRSITYKEEMLTYCGFSITVDNFVVTALSSEELWDRIMGGVRTMKKKVEDMKRAERQLDADRDEG